MQKYRLFSNYNDNQFKMNILQNNTMNLPDDEKKPMRKHSLK